MPEKKIYEITMREEWGAYAQHKKEFSDHITISVKEGDSEGVIANKILHKLKYRKDEELGRLARLYLASRPGVKIISIIEKPSAAEVKKMKEQKEQAEQEEIEYQKELSQQIEKEETERKELEGENPHKESMFSKGFVLKISNNNGKGDYNMKDPFGIQGNKMVLTAEQEKDNVVKKEKKSVDMVKVFLASVPSLENAKDALTEIAENAQDPELKKQIEGFINSILKITEDILDLTKVEIRGVRQETLEEMMPQDSKPQTITPGMISGEEQIPAIPATPVK